MDDSLVFYHFLSISIATCGSFRVVVQILRNGPFENFKNRTINCLDNLKIQNLHRFIKSHIINLLNKSHFLRKFNAPACEQRSERYLKTCVNHLPWRKPYAQIVVRFCCHVSVESKRIELMQVAKLFGCLFGGYIHEFNVIFCAKQMRQQMNQPIYVHANKHWQFSMHETDVNIRYVYTVFCSDGMTIGIRLARHSGDLLGECQPFCLSRFHEMLPVCMYGLLSTVADLISSMNA